MIFLASIKSCLNYRCVFIYLCHFQLISHVPALIIFRFLFLSLVPYVQEAVDEFKLDLTVRLPEKANELGSRISELRFVQLSA